MKASFSLTSASDSWIQSYQRQWKLNSVLPAPVKAEFSLTSASESWIQSYQRQWKLNSVLPAPVKAEFSLTSASESWIQSYQRQWKLNSVLPAPLKAELSFTSATERWIQSVQSWALPVEEVWPPNTMPAMHTPRVEQFISIVSAAHSIQLNGSVLTVLVSAVTLLRMEWCSRGFCFLCPLWETCTVCESYYQAI